MATVALIGVGVGAVVSAGVTVYSAQETKKANKKAAETKKKEMADAKAADIALRKQAAAQEANTGAKFQDNTATVDSGTSIDDLFVGAKQESTTGLAGATPISSPIKA